MFFGVSVPWWFCIPQNGWKKCGDRRGVREGAAARGTAAFLQKGLAKNLQDPLRRGGRCRGLHGGRGEPHGRSATARERVRELRCAAARGTAAFLQKGLAKNLQNPLRREVVSGICTAGEVFLRRARWRKGSRKVGQSRPAAGCPRRKASAATTGRAADAEKAGFTPHGFAQPAQAGGRGEPLVFVGRPKEKI